LLHVYFALPTNWQARVISAPTKHIACNMHEAKEKNISQYQTVP
jgi:hypothetical protein